MTLPLACPTILNRSYSSALIYYKTTTPASPPMSIKDCQSLDLLYVSTSLITETSTNRNTNFIINIYSDSNQTARQYLQQNIINLEGTIILTGDLNIRDMSWLGKTAKSLFIFLFFSFLFLFLLIGLTTTRWSMGKSHVTLSQCHNGVMDGHRWSCHGSQSQCVAWLE